MGVENVDCDHRCRNTCAMLTEGLKVEIKQVAYYEQMLRDCDEPEVRKFAKELFDAHKDLAHQIAERLSIIKTKAQVLDEIIAGYES